MSTVSNWNHSARRHQVAVRNHLQISSSPPAYSRITAYYSETSSTSFYPRALSDVARRAACLFIKAGSEVQALGWFHVGGTQIKHYFCGFPWGHTYTSVHDRRNAFLHRVRPWRKAPDPEGTLPDYKCLHERTDTEQRATCIERMHRGEARSPTKCSRVHCRGRGALLGVSQSAQ